MLDPLFISPFLSTNVLIISSYARDVFNNVHLYSHLLGCTQGKPTLIIVFSRGNIHL